jgi:polyisoprenoid-binding protein YceI
MKNTARLFLVAFTATLPLLWTSFALAQHQTLIVNPVTSTVAFTLASNHDTTTGTFHVDKGTVDFDRSSPKLTGLIVVSATSGNTGNDGRDKKMFKDVLDAARFSDITFAPESYTGTLAATGDSTLQVTGVFTLHGTPHPLTVPMHLHVDGATCVAKTHFQVPYVEWGLKDPSWFVLKAAKEVDVDLSLSGALTLTN